MHETLQPGYVWVKCPNGHGNIGQQHFDYCGKCHECSTVLVECEAPADPLRERVERLVVELHGAELLSEGQCAQVLGVDRVSWRKIADETVLERPAARNIPPSAYEGEYDVRRPIDRAINAFHQERELASTEPYDWSPNMMKAARAGMQAARAALVPQDDQIARAIWSVRRKYEDRCDMELEDMGQSHPVWQEAAAVRALLAANPAEQRMSDAARDVLAERARHVSGEGWTPEHDDQYVNGELARAASCYAHASASWMDQRFMPSEWPWDSSWWKPTTQRRNLEKAGALIIGEIERIDRAARKAAQEAARHA